ncbi:transcriptional regulator [Bifidobacterium sp. B4107]|uniref:helix-turn-helix transcriptional regulator n=1 Tax=unclassified Bifidobacterium TaxID=2608897 RepID=UPI00226B5105|nr:MULTISPECIES: PAS domain-containing protein [unclassified Bifidobacterium]MCX8647024.1 transcriptional regulator [Bifidobacterium sp. B4107]MCX8651204.1 transcriptional regulator [Bifidobacterium sp. B4111]MCX8657634.1 transcriptional regulator [Bifidobacterium sp. B4114]
MGDSKPVSPALRPFIPLVDFLGEILGPNAEVVLQSVKDFSHSVVAIANGHLSGRTIGSPATDLVLRIWQNHKYEQRDYLTHYTGYTIQGHPMVSSTFFLRDARGRVIGFLCINFDNSAFRQASQQLRQASAYLDALGLTGPAAELKDRGTASEKSDAQVGRAQPTSGAVRLNDKTVGDQSTREVLSVNTNELVTHNIADFAAELEVPPARVNRQERLQLITRLEGSGVFLIKGAVDTVAQALEVSSASIYRYLHTIRNAGAGPDQSRSARQVQR